MSALVVIGAQWGDEGKGKVVDLYSEYADIVVRCSGGANAGHTLVHEGTTLITHLIPSGVMHPGTVCVLGDAMVIDPWMLIDEIKHCQTQGLLASNDDLLISRRAHVVMPYHKTLEASREKKASAIGTTLRGIGPAYEAKVARRGVRMGDLINKDRLRDLITQNMEEFTGTDHIVDSVESMTQEAYEIGKQLEAYYTDTGLFIHESLQSNRRVLFEGAQGTMLDVDHGTYPYVTSSSTISGGACIGGGVGPTAIDAVIGIAKAYTTRVGHGPFPTRLDIAEEENMRALGNEFGATTGRPRECGWLDMVALRYAVRINGMTGLALTKLDVLGGLDVLKICTAYDIGDRQIQSPPDTLDDFSMAQPCYESFDGWTEDIQNVRSRADLPKNAQAYVKAIETMLDIPLTLLSVGPQRQESIEISRPFGL